MRAIRFLSFIVLIGLSLNLYAAQAVERAEYGGLMHSAIGDAHLELVEDGLVISNIGEGGFDGVQVELGELQSFSASWRNFSSMNIPIAASMQLGTRLKLADEDNTTRFAFIILQGIFFERDGLNLLEIAPNLTQTTGASHRYEVYANSNQLAVATSASERIIARVISNAHVPYPNRIELVTDSSGAPGYALRWENLNDVLQIIFPFRDGPPINADEVRIFSGTESWPLQSFGELNLWLSQIPELKITSEEAVR